ncbi:hypothetical protein H0R92_10730 [Treponema sp. OMZ 840]|uniref:xylulokinase n=1 Tax=Treponema sp. OMZ 840 TaxID=244313 RepID=UPI003D916F95
MSYILGFDIGTTASKAILTDCNGKIYAEFSRQHDIQIKNPGWQEENMSLWWDEFCQAVFYFASINPQYPRGIGAIGITGLIPALCAVDTQGEPLEPAILHTDVRAFRELEYLNTVLESPISHAFMLPKIKWLADNRKDVFKKIYKIMAPHNYLVYRLTKKAAIDYDTAYMVGGVFDEQSLNWNFDVIRKLGLPESIFPDMFPANHIAGTVCKDVADRLGINPQAQVIVGVGDTFSSILGGGAQDKNHLMIYLGTSATILYAEGSPKHYINIPHYGPGKAQFIGRIASYGETVNHWRSIFAVNDWEKLEQALEAKPAGADNLWYFPHYKMQTDKSFFSLDAEHLLGLSGSHDYCSIYRAVIEGIAWNIRRNIEGLKGPVKQINIFGGGAKSKTVLKIMAAVLDRPVTVNPKSSTAIGIAFLAGLSAGLIDDFNRLTDTWFSDSFTVEVDASLSACYKKIAPIYYEMSEQLEKINGLFAKRGLYE